MNDPSNDLYRPIRIIPVLTRLFYHVHRPFLRLPFKGVGAEVGVYRGEFSKALLKNKEVEMLYMIDPYFYDGAEEMPSRDLARAKTAALKIASRCPERTTLMIERSLDAIKKLPPMDFVYLDGSHVYEAVRKDLDAYWPLVKPGGILGGHDFHISWLSVIKAVSEFAVQHKLTLYVESPDWWIVKSNPLQPAQV